MSCLAFRLGERRTVGELAPFDLAAIIVIGAVVGGTATGRNSVTIGVTAIAGLLLAHALVTRLRRLAGARKLVDQSPVVLVRSGVVQPHGLRRAGLTGQDPSAALRAHGVRSLHTVELAVFEPRSGVSVLLGPDRAPLWDDLRTGDGRAPPTSRKHLVPLDNDPTSAPETSRAPRGRVEPPARRLPHRAADVDPLTHRPPFDLPRETTRLALAAVAG